MSPLAMPVRWRTNGATLARVTTDLTSE